MKISFLPLSKLVIPENRPKINLFFLFLVALFFFLGGFFLAKYLVPPIILPIEEEKLRLVPEEILPEIETELNSKIEPKPEIQPTWDDLTIIQLREELIMKVAQEAFLATVAIETKTSCGLTSFGSGFIISPDGLVVTNRHIVLPMKPVLEYRVIIYDHTIFLAQMVDSDPFQDLAILQIKPLKNQPLPVFSYLPLGDSDLLRLGQTVVFIGHLLGELPHSVNVGTIAYLHRDIFVMSDFQNQIKINNAIQITAVVNLGNSGGPLLNLNGELVGMVTAKGAIGEGIGFALPINDLKESIQEVKNDGEIIHPFLGIAYTNLGPTFIQKHQMPGFLVVNVTPHSPAFNFINQGDIIIKMNNQPIEINTSLGKVIRRYHPGDKISVTVIRDEQRIVIKDIILTKRED